MRRGVRAERLLGVLHHALVPTARPNPVILTWRWRYEITLSAGLALALVALVGTVGPNLTILMVAGATAALLGWPAARRRLIARAWCVLTPHRVRAGCAQARIHTTRGRLPAVLWCAPRTYGEQLLLWCPAGVIPEDFIPARHILAGACYASDVEVVPHPGHRHLVTLAVIRHEEGHEEGREATVPARVRTAATGRPEARSAIGSGA